MISNKQPTLEEIETVQYLQMASSAGGVIAAFVCCLMAVKFTALQRRVEGLLRVM